LIPVRTAAPEALPLSLEEVRLYLRVDHTDEDLVIQSLIEAATTYLDGYAGTLNMALMPQTWEQRYSAFPSSPVRLTVTPVQSAAVTYYDALGALQTVPEASYAVEVTPGGTMLALAPGEAWPDDIGSDSAVTVSYVAGHASALAVPADIRHAMQLMIAAWFDNRDAGEIPQSAHWLLNKYLASAF